MEFLTGKESDKMKKQPMTERWFKCPECGAVFRAFKSSAKRTSAGHVKDLYCPWCKKDRKMVQIKYY